MRPYSQDLRDRVIAAVIAGEQPQADIAETFAISPSTLEKWWARFRRTGACAPRPHKGGRPRALATAEATLRAEVAAQPDATLDELCQRVAQAEGIQASKGTMSCELQRLRLPRKKSRSTTASGTRRGSRRCASASARGSAARCGTSPGGCTSWTRPAPIWA